MSASCSQLANLVLLEVTFRVKLQYKQKRSNKNQSISKQPVGPAKITQKNRNYIVAMISTEGGG